MNNKMIAGAVVVGIAAGFVGVMSNASGTKTVGVSMSAFDDNFLTVLRNGMTEYAGTLEGDFDRHFTLYAPDGYGRDALYLLTPDLMSRLIDSARAFDVSLLLTMACACGLRLTSPTSIPGRTKSAG